MKALKITVIVLVTLVLLVLTGAFIFLKTVDVNKYMPMVQDQVQKAVGRDLKIGRAHLQVSLLHGIALEVSGIALSDDRRFSDQAFLSVDKILLGLSLKPLIMERKIQIAGITVVSPKIVIIRNKEGLINAAMMGAGTSDAGADNKADSSGKMAALPALLVDRITISNATITYLDDMFSPRLALNVEHLDLVMQGFSLTESFSFVMKAAVFSAEQNLEVSGGARLALNTASVLVTDAKLNMDLSKISSASLNAMLPMLAPAGLKDQVKGKLTVIVPELQAGNSGLKSLKMNGSLAGGQISSSILPLPISDIALSFDGNEKDIVLKSCDMHFADGTINVSGTVRGYMSSPLVDMTGKVYDLGLGKISEAYHLPVKVNGKAVADMKLTLSGKTPEEMTASLKAELSASLKDGTLEGINLVQTGLGNIPMLPTLWNMVQASLPAATQEDLNKGRTVIDSADALVYMNGMTANVSRAEVVTRDVLISLKGKAKVPETVDLNMDIFLQKDIANVLVQKVPDLAGLRDGQGKLYIPCKLTGSMLKPGVQPDVEYLSKKLILNRGKDALQKVIEKNPEVKGVLNSLFGSAQSGEGNSQPAAQESNTAGQAPQSDNTQAVDSLLNNLFKKK
ncbi:MAG: AsmA family protein [Candidatus Omnitrophica bacterium]|nr:AsmA family protein [Candidatus Omnitrophota bacterium]